MKTIQVMFGIVLVFLFAGPLAAFLLGTVDAAQNAGARGAQINNTEAMAQFIMYATYTGYQCTPDAGGFKKTAGFGGTYWTSWAQIRDNADGHNDFEELNESYGGKSEFNCYGVENKLPLSQGFLDEINPIDSDNWINDQEGEYSKRDFTITEKTGSDEAVRLGPCWTYRDTSGSVGDSGAFFYVMGPDTPNIIRYFTDDSWGSRNGDAMDEVSEGLSPGDCMLPVDSYGSQPSKGPVGTLTVIDPGSTTNHQDSTNMDGFSDVGCATCSANGWSNEPAKEWHLCPGTEGYIQVNVGKNSNEKDGSGWDDRTQDYSAEYDILPGNPDLEAAGSIKANTIHPFIVITNLETPSGNPDCTPP